MITVTETSLLDFLFLYQPLVENTFPHAHTPSEIQKVRHNILLELERNQVMALHRGKTLRYFYLCVDGVALPYMECPEEGTGLSVFGHPFETRLMDLHEYYSSCLSGSGLLTPAEKLCGLPIHYPVVYKSDFKDYETLVRKHTGKSKLVSQMLGEKSKKVQWYWRNQASLTDIEELLPLVYQHNADYAQRNGLSDPLLIGWANYAFDPNVGMVMAADVDEGQVVSGMACWKGVKTYNADTLSRNTSEIYRPYQLVLCAHLAMMRDIFWSSSTGIDQINLGLNFSRQEYKSFLPYKEVPLLNLPYFPPGSSGKDIAALFEKHRRENSGNPSSN